MKQYYIDRIRKTNYCWHWTGSIAKDGYGQAVGQQAHRAVYKQLVGEIPAKMTLDHLCRNKSCVNPEHLEIVTQRENILRGDTQAGKNARKTHCVNGHEFNEQNTNITPRGWRICRKCRYERLKRYRKR